MKNVMPAMGTRTALTVKKCRTLCKGIQIAGSEITQKRKKHIKSRVVVPEDAGIELGMLFTLGHMARSKTNTQVPPMLACTPYHILWRPLCHCNKAAQLSATYQAITARFRIHHKLPQIPKLARATTGKVMWNIAPGRAFNTKNGAEMPHPIQTQIQACHQESPN